MATQALVIFSKDAAAGGMGPGEVGGKAAALAELGRIGVQVPEWFCVPVRSFYDSDASARDLAILAAFDRLFPPNARVAVRSSAVGEDSARDSFAGQLDTFLYVPRDELLARIADCVASASSQRARAYRRRRGLDASPLRIAVLVQRMIDSRASGILFTANPTTCDRSEAVISAGLGLGEGIVAGRVETDTFFLALDTGQIKERTIAEKRSRVMHGPKSGTVLERVGDAEATAAAIQDGEAQSLLETARRIQSHFGVPQDIEWAIDEKRDIYFLQARPITTLERETIFDSSNIVESFPGLTSPLTFTFIRRSYEEAFREAQRRTGVPEATLEANRHVHANLVGILDGRVYYNILHWYRLFTWVPGFEGLLPAWEKALGVDRRFASRTRAPVTLATRIGQARVIESNLRRFLMLQRDVDAFVEDLAIVQRDLATRDLDALDGHELLELLESSSRRLLRPYAVSVLNDLYAQQLYDVLAKLIAAWKLGDRTTLRNELLCGEQGMESVAPVRALVAIARRVRETPAVAKAFAEHDDAALVRHLPHDAELATLRAEIDEHLRVYGDRALEELKLETPSLRERPDFLLAMIRNYVRGKQDVAAMESHEAQIRENAEAVAYRGLDGEPIRRRIFDFVLRASRRTIKNRENLRLARSRAYGVVRSFYRAIAKRLVAKRVLDAESDIFFLTTDEVDGAVRGSSVTRDLRALVKLRRSEYEGYARSRPAARLNLRGLVQGATIEQEDPIDMPSGAILRGIPCSPGRKVAPAKVVLDPDRDAELNGEILVAPMTDPAWAYLMVAAGGLVAERGSILSHTAIIGRELGVPTVVGVAGATRAIATGAMIEIDGTEGTVRILSATEPAEAAR
ncbi:MAG: PEP/pyruvate-binding domain-containing protein [Polyangiaceae bacterium]